jgi:acyl carrier protein
MGLPVHNDSVLAAVYEAVDRLNETLPLDKQVPKSSDTRLIGAGGHLDSLGAVNLIVETEEAVEERLGIRINLGDERAASQAIHPLSSISSLVEYIQALLK